MAAVRVDARWVIANHGEALIGDDRIVDPRGEHATPRPQPVAAPPVDRSTLPVLDPEQQAAVDLPADTSLVLDGEAGVGKTLVALFRIASLERRARAAGRRFARWSSCRPRACAAWCASSPTGSRSRCSRSP
jgi:hypothetical protein